MGPLLSQAFSAPRADLPAAFYIFTKIHGWKKFSTCAAERAVEKCEEGSWAGEGCFFGEPLCALPGMPWTTVA